MSRVAEIQTTLVGAFVGTVLQTDDRIAGAKLFIGKLARVLLRFLRSDRRLAELGALKLVSKSSSGIHILTAKTAGRCINSNNSNRA